MLGVNLFESMLNTCWQLQQRTEYTISDRVCVYVCVCVMPILARANFALLLLLQLFYLLAIVWTLINATVDKGKWVALGWGFGFGWVGSGMAVCQISRRGLSKF